MSKFDVKEMVAQRVIAQMEEGIIPWRQPWFGASDGAYSHKTGKSYSLLNQIMLGDDHEYCTMTDIKNAGGKLNKGSKAKQVVFWKLYPRTVHNDETGEDETKNFAILRYYNVFDIADTDLKPRKRKTGNATESAEAEDVVNDYINRSGVRINRNRVSNQAYYMPSTDCIVVPELDQYETSSEYYSTLFHEMTHSTGHKSRLDRISETAGFASESYSKEELVAELGAASLVNFCGLEIPQTFKNSTAYIQNWLEALKNDKNLIISAAGKAQKAVEYILGDKLADNEQTDEQKDTTETTETAETTAPETKKAEIVEEPEVIAKTVNSKAELKRLIKEGKKVTVTYLSRPDWPEMVGVERQVTYGQSNGIMINTSWLYYSDFTLKDGKLTLKNVKDAVASVVVDYAA